MSYCPQPKPSEQHLMSKVHWQATPDFKTACGLQASATIPYTRNAADVDCKTCQRLIPDATLTIWDRILDEEEAVPVVPVRKTRKPKARPTTVMVGRRSGMSMLAAREVLNRTNSMTQSFNEAHGVGEERVEPSQVDRYREWREQQLTQYQYRIESPGRHGASSWPLLP